MKIIEVPESVQTFIGHKKKVFVNLNCVRKKKIVKEVFVNKYVLATFNTEKYEIHLKHY